jgi:hypothetical protein
MLLAEDARVAAPKPNEVLKGQVWRFKAGGPIRIVQEVNGDTVIWRKSEGQEEHERSSNAPGMLKMKDAYLIGQEPEVTVTEADNAAKPEGEPKKSG